MSRPPRELGETLVRRTIEGRTVWVSKDGKWAVMSAAELPTTRPSMDMGPALGLPLDRHDDIEDNRPTVLMQPEQAPDHAKAWRVAYGLVGLSVLMITLTAGIWLGRGLMQRAAPVPTPQMAPAPAPTVPATKGSEDAAPDTPADAAAEPPKAQSPAPEAAPTPGATEAESTPKPASTPTPAKTQAAKPPTQAAKPATQAVKPAPKPPSASRKVASLTEDGWRLVERDPRQAANAFRDALALNASHADATYGLGYALLKLGDTPGATTYLCRAARYSSTAREAGGLVKTHKLTCP